VDPTYKLRGTASIKFTSSAEYLKVDNRRYGDVHLFPTRVGSRHKSSYCQSRRFVPELSNEKANDERKRARERDDEYYAMDGNGRVRCIIK